MLKLKQFVLLAVSSVTHYTPRLFSFKTSRPKAFKFRSGEFVMLGLIIKCKLVLRAYSVCSATWASDLEFYSIKASNGPFTSYLQKITTDSLVLMRTKPTGTLVLEGLRSGDRLFLFCTGTGVAPFLSIISDPRTYVQFKEVIVVLTCRERAELKFLFIRYAELLKEAEFVRFTDGKLRFYTSVTRQSYPFVGRVTHIIKSGVLLYNLNLSCFDIRSRFMICGSQAMISDTIQVLSYLGFKEGSLNNPQDFVYEKAFTN